MAIGIRSRHREEFLKEKRKKRFEKPEKRISVERSHDLPDRSLMDSVWQQEIPIPKPTLETCEALFDVPDQWSYEWIENLFVVKVKPTQAFFDFDTATFIHQKANDTYDFHSPDPSLPHPSS